MLDPWLADLVQTHSPEFDVFLEAHPEVARLLMPGLVMFGRTFVYWLHDEGRVSSDDAKRLLAMLRSYEMSLAE